ncbi:Peroxiredoxin [Virgibacillus subterraneus]|uniref:Peroxiredoxin n=2 Tax=Virgibacillus TaxID=84406 RepID=A0A1H1DU67_9BACI|nr:MULTISPECIES: TlpA disulfide reductase family protein [Virgibacillus]SDQ79456.1 Peroxiredoxin [Virgibacillus salinus]SEQ89383.1 Peroxiredoxin [Virgibacillus subterraneus]
MKKLIVIVLAIGMIGWAVYDFAIANDDTSVQEEDGNISGNSISAPMDEEENAEEEVVNSDEVGLEEGQIAPDFELKTLEGKTVKLSDFRGERVLVNFWATWCPPCREEMPDMQKFYENKDLEILAVNLTETENSEEDVTEFVEDFELTFPILMDENSDVANAYQVRAYPTSYMIDSNGRIQFIAMGAMNYEMMVEELAKME